jgi:hypothetical protein
MVRLDEEKLLLEREKIELRRPNWRTKAEQRTEAERKQAKAQLQQRAEEERILAIDIDTVTNPRLRAYYKKLQDEIMERMWLQQFNSWRFHLFHVIQAWFISC